MVLAEVIAEQSYEFFEVTSIVMTAAYSLYKEDQLNKKELQKLQRN